MVRVLAVSDEVSEELYADPAVARDAELILACGDLPFDYLDYLMNALDVPLSSSRVTMIPMSPATGSRAAG